MRLERGTRITSTIAVAVASSVMTTILLAGGYAVASTALAPNSVTSANIVNGTIRGVDLSARLRGRIGTPGPQGPAGPQGPVGPSGPQGPAGLDGLHEVQIPFPLPPEDYILSCGHNPEWNFLPFDSCASSVGYGALRVDSAAYPSTATMRFEYSVKDIYEVCMRLFDLAANAAVGGSEICPGADDDPNDNQPVLARTDPIDLPEGEHLFALQARSELETYGTAAWLIIEWP